MPYLDRKRIGPLALRKIPTAHGNASPNVNVTTFGSVWQGFRHTLDHHSLGSPELHNRWHQGLCVQDKVYGLEFVCQCHGGEVVWKCNRWGRREPPCCKNLQCFLQPYKQREGLQSFALPGSGGSTVSDTGRVCNLGGVAWTGPGGLSPFVLHSAVLGFLVPCSESISFRFPLPAVLSSFIDMFHNRLDRLDKR
jgi:hypothetical protein